MSKSCQKPIKDFAGLPQVDTLDCNIPTIFHFREEQPLLPCGTLLSGPLGAGKRTVARATSKRLNLHTFEVSCYDLIGESVAATEARLKNAFQKGQLTYCIFATNFKNFAIFTTEKKLFTTLLKYNVRPKT